MQRRQTLRNNKIMRKFTSFVGQQNLLQLIDIKTKDKKEIINVNINLNRSQEEEQMKIMKKRSKEEEFMLKKRNLF